MSTNTEAKKYLFTSFGGNSNSQAAQFTKLYETKTSTDQITSAELKYSISDIEQIKKEYFESGLAQGIKQTNEQFENVVLEQNQIINKALANILDQIKLLEEKNSQEIKTTSEKLTSLSYEVAKKISGFSIKNFPLERLTETFNKFLTNLAAIQNIQIFIEPNLKVKLEEKITALTIDNVAKIHIIPDPTIPLGDIRLEWKDGGADLKHGDLMQELEKIVQDFTLIS